MVAPFKSYTQSLRVIGQALEILRISTFALEKKGDKYVVIDWEPSYLKSTTDDVGGIADSGHAQLPTQNSREVLVYDKSDTERLETQGRSRRGASGSQVRGEVSSGLRVVGDYLPR